MRQVLQSGHGTVLLMLPVDNSIFLVFLDWSACSYLSSLHTRMHCYSTGTDLSCADCNSIQLYIHDGGPSVCRVKA